MPLLCPLCEGKRGVLISLPLCWSQDGLEPTAYQTLATGKESFAPGGGEEGEDTPYLRSLHPYATPLSPLHFTGFRAWTRKCWFWEARDLKGKCSFKPKVITAPLSFSFPLCPFSTLFQWKGKEGAADLRFASWDPGLFQSFAWLKSCLAFRDPCFSADV